MQSLKKILLIGMLRICAIILESVASDDTCYITSELVALDDTFLPNQCMFRVLSTTILTVLMYKSVRMLTKLEKQERLKLHRFINSLKQNKSETCQTISLAEFIPTKMSKEEIKRFVQSIVEKNKDTPLTQEDYYKYVLELQRLSPNNAKDICYYLSLQSQEIISKLSLLPWRFSFVLRPDQIHSIFDLHTNIEEARKIFQSMKSTSRNVLLYLYPRKYIELEHNEEYLKELDQNYEDLTKLSTQQEQITMFNSLPDINRRYLAILYRNDIRYFFNFNDQYKIIDIQVSINGPVKYENLYTYIPNIYDGYYASNAIILLLQKYINNESFSIMDVWHIYCSIPEYQKQYFVDQLRTYAIDIPILDIQQLQMNGTQEDLRLFMSMFKYDQSQIERIITKVQQRSDLTRIDMIDVIVTQAAKAPSPVRLSPVKFLDYMIR